MPGGGGGSEGFTTFGGTTAAAALWSGQGLNPEPDAAGSLLFPAGGAVPSTAAAGEFVDGPCFHSPLSGYAGAALRPGCESPDDAAAPLPIVLEDVDVFELAEDWADASPDLASCGEDGVVEDAEFIELVELVEFVEPVEPVEPAVALAPGISFAAALLSAPLAELESLQSPGAATVTESANDSRSTRRFSNSR